MSTLATLDIDGRTARLTLNRPDARNALSIDLLQALHARVDELANQDGVSVLVLTGAGKCFCAGMDLKAVLNDPDAPTTLLRLLADVAIKIRALPMAVIARVNGAAIGGGCGLTCVCDFCVTHADSKMGFPEVDLGLCPAVVAPWLVHKIGAGRARAILLRGGVMSGRQAHDAGIASHLADSLEQLDETVDELSSSLAAGGPGALGATKSLLNRLDGSLDRDIARHAADLSARILASDEAQRALRARFGTD